ncbi:MAG: hypothetical protein K2L93_02100 [Muribaculaceae bacterium]|nr:hypothetical protein [Muribaculaceae bacterium]
MSNENTIFDNNQSTQYNDNENTVFDTVNNSTAPVDETNTPAKGKGSMWKKVVIGGAAGLVFGGGATAAVAMTSSKPADTDTKAKSSNTDDTKSTDDKADETKTDDTKDNEVKTDDTKNNELNADGKDGELDVTPIQSENVDPQAPAQPNDVNITINHTAGTASSAASGSAPAEVPAAPAVQNINITVIDHGDLTMATNVTDDMSFAQAFAAARAELGTGGVFEWHGNLYNTYTVEEWNAMGEAQQNQFANNISYGGGEQPVDPIPAESHIAQEPSVTIVEPAEPQVQVLGVEYNPDLEANIAEVMIDDQQVYLIDVNDDDLFDVAVADLNNDGELQADEISDVSELNITVDDLGGYTGFSSADYNIDNDLALDDSATPYEI